MLYNAVLVSATRQHESATGIHLSPGFDPWVGKTPYWRKWQPTPVFLPGESHGQGSLVGYSPWGRRESDTAEHTHTSLLTLHPIPGPSFDSMFSVSPVVRQSHAGPPRGTCICKETVEVWEGNLGLGEVSAVLTPGDGAASGQGSFLPPFKVFMFVQLSGWAYLWPPNQGQSPESGWR